MKISKNDYANHLQYHVYDDGKILLVGGLQFFCSGCYTMMQRRVMKGKGYFVTPRAFRDFGDEIRQWKWSEQARRTG